MNVSLAGKAQGEVLEAIAYYKRSGGTLLGRAFVFEFERSVALLSVHPLIGSQSSGVVRRFALRRFPYIIVYEARETELRIVAVAHQRRRPGYWIKRS